MMDAKTQSTQRKGAKTLRNLRALCGFASITQRVSLPAIPENTSPSSPASKNAGAQEVSPERRNETKKSAEVSAKPLRLRVSAAIVPRLQLKKCMCQSDNPDECQARICVEWYLFTTHTAESYIHLYCCAVPGGIAAHLAIWSSS
jgi:hypothetical protein